MTAKEYEVRIASRVRAQADPIGYHQITNGNDLCAKFYDDDLYNDFKEYLKSKGHKLVDKGVVSQADWE